MKVPSRWLRAVHKWTGLILGVQLILWTLSGAAMSLLDHEAVNGGPDSVQAPTPLPAVSGWARVQAGLGDEPVIAAALRPLLGGHVYEVSTASGPLLFDAASGRRVTVDEALARRIAEAGHPGRPAVIRAAPLRKLELAVREHTLPIWRVDFADDARSSYYVSATTGALLERRDDTWRAWDFFWMLHNMDYRDRASFNHPLIIFVAFGTVWLAVTGFWLLFRAAWKSDARLLKRWHGR